MKTLLFTLACLILLLPLSAQDTLFVYVDTLGITQDADDPGLYRIPLRTTNFTEVTGIQIELSIAGQDAARIVDLEMIDELVSQVSEPNVAADSQSVQYLYLNVTGEVTLPVDTLMGQLLVRADLIDDELTVNCDLFEAVRAGNQDAEIVSRCSGASRLRYRPNRSLSGQVVTPAGAAVPGIPVILLDVETQVGRRATTDEMGGYTFREVPTQGNYQVFVNPPETVEPRSERIPGVNVADVVLLLRHLRGVATLDTPLARLAAPVGDGVPSVVDVVQLQRYILGATDAFPAGVYYRFLTGSDAPAQSADFPDGLSEDTIVNFTIIKVGDVNFSGL